MSESNNGNVIFNPNDPNDHTMKNIADAYVTQDEYNRAAMRKALRLLSEREQKEFAKEISFFGALRHEERQRIKDYEYESEVLLNVNRIGPVEEQTHPKVEVIAVLNYLIDENVIDADRYEVLCDVVDKIYQ